jgi:hypothetical protein
MDDLGNAVSRLQASGPPDIVDSSAGAYAMRLQWARERCLRALEGTAVGSADDAWRELLLPAARQLLEALGSMADDERLWSGVLNRTVKAHVQPPLKAQEVITQDLSALLLHMGHRPPPLAELLELEFKEALMNALEAGQGPSASQVRRVQRHLGFYTFRLRGLIAQAEADLEAEAGEPRERRVQDLPSWQRMRGAVDKGARVAIPAAFATGVVTLLFPPATGPAAAAGFVAATTAAGQELLKQGTQLAAMGMMDTWLAEESTLVPPGQKRAAARRRTQRALGDLRSLLASDHLEADWSQFLDVLIIESRSALYELRTMEDASPQRSRHELPHTVDELLALIDEIDNAPSDLQTSHSRHDLARQVATMENSLTGVFSRIG